jgi:tetratricopeptide (TPR) repeat protein
MMRPSVGGESLPFVNRNEELERWDKIAEDEVLSGKSRVVIYRAEPASGLTRFLRECALRHSGDCYTFLLEGSNQVANSIFSQILFSMEVRYGEIWDEWEAYLEDVSGRHSSAEHAVKLTEAIPYVGSFVSEVAQAQLEDLAVGYSEYPSAVAELLCRFLAEISEDRRFLFFVDDAQELDAWSMDLLRTTGTGTYSRLSYVLGFVDREGDRGQMRDPRSRFESLGYSVTEVRFTKPDVRFVEALADELDTDVDERKARQLAQRGPDDINRLIASVRAGEDSSDRGQLGADRLEPLALQILRYLIVAEQRIRASTLVDLCIDTSDVFVLNTQDVHESLSELEQENLVAARKLPDGDFLVGLEAVSRPEIEELQADRPALLAAAEDLYRYHEDIDLETSKRYSRSEVLPLLFRLSVKTVSSKAERYAEELLELSLRTGSIGAAREFISTGVTAEGLDRPRAILLRSAFHIAVRDYRRALGLLSSELSTSWVDHHVARVFRAICLNRVRDHEGSERLIDSLLRDEATSFDEKVALASFKIGGRLHENDVEGAREVFRELRPELESASSYGRFIRNAASTFPPERAMELLNEGRRRCKDEGDEFGELTCLANQGGFRLELGDFEAALSDLTEARSGLERFGVHHIHVAENNLGICNLYLDDLDAAENNLQRAVAYTGHESMGGIYAAINVALLRALQGRRDDAEGIVRDLEPLVDESPVDRVHQRFYLVRGAINEFAKGDPAQTQLWINNALDHPDRMDPHETRERVKRLEEARTQGDPLGRDELLEVTPLCRLSYWYSNPLELLSGDLLPP